MIIIYHFFFYFIDWFFNCFNEITNCFNWYFNLTCFGFSSAFVVTLIHKILQNLPYNFEMVDHLICNVLVITLYHSTHVLYIFIKRHFAFSWHFMIIPSHSRNLPKHFTLFNIKIFYDQFFVAQIISVKVWWRKFYHCYMKYSIYSRISFIYHWNLKYLLIYFNCMKINNSFRIWNYAQWTVKNNFSSKSEIIYTFIYLDAKKLL